MFSDIIELLLAKKEKNQKKRAELDATDARIDKMLTEAGYQPPVENVATVEEISAVEPAPVVEEPAIGGIVYGCQIY